MAEAADEYLSMDQLTAMGSPARSELVHALMALGPATVADLARQLGKSPKGLYYHLRELERVGLVRSEVRRGESGREEALYEVTTRRLRVNPLADEEYREEVKRGVRMILRLAEREHNRWLDGMQENPDWRGRGTLVRSRMRVPPEVAVEAVNRIVELHRFLRDSEVPDGVTVSILLALFPAEDDPGAK